jgi:hypothetical protein
MSQEPATTDEQPHKIEDSAAPVSKQEAENNQAAIELNKAKDGSQLSMNVRVHSPFKNYYDGVAFSVTAENQTGPFDILPKHHNFISLLTACEMIIRTTKGEQKIQISGGIMHVKADELIVFLDV